MVNLTAEIDSHIINFSYETYFVADILGRKVHISIHSIDYINIDTLPQAKIDTNMLISLDWDHKIVEKLIEENSNLDKLLFLAKAQA